MPEHFSRGLEPSERQPGVVAYFFSAAPSIFSPPRWMSFPAPATVLQPAESAAIESNMTRKTLFFINISCLSVGTEVSIPQRPQFAQGRPDGQPQARSGPDASPPPVTAPTPGPAFEAAHYLARL
ncbi:hypothetical protein D3C86_1011500 [compost metagenome]